MSAFPPPVPPSPSPFPDGGAQVPIDDVGEVRAWPKVVGITSIVVGSTGLLCSGCGTASSAMSLSGGQTMEPRGPDGKPMVMPDMIKAGPVDLVGGVLGLTLALVLITSGAVLLGRKSIARLLHLGYGAAAALVSVVFTAHGVMKLLAFKAWAAENPTEQAAKMAPFIIGAGAVMTAFGLLIGLGYPIFCLVWFGLVKRSSAEITRGVQGTAA